MSSKKKPLLTPGERLAMLASLRPTVVVDWDGTCVPSAWPDRPTEWLPGAEKAINDLLDYGLVVQIHSTRLHAFEGDYKTPNTTRKEDYDYIRKMLDTAGFTSVGIIEDSKPGAVAYVDDKAIRYEGDWQAVVDQITMPNEGELPTMMRKFDTGATRDQDDTKHDYEGYLSPTVLRRFAEFMTKHRVQADGQLRDSDNWQKGIPQDAYLKSLLRHVMELWLDHRGEIAEDEKGQVVDVQDALCAIIFNAQGYLHEELKHGG
jgi:hypothetical protein